MFVAYDKSILSYVAAIRNYFDLSSSFPADVSFDEYLNKQRPQRVFVFLIDALGYELLQRKLSPEQFLRKNILYHCDTVFPSTTTAATTSIRNGKAPNENAWLGWTQYFHEADDIIVPFLAKGFYSDIQYEHSLIAEALPLKTTEEELLEKGIKAGSLFPSFARDGCESLQEMCERLVKLSYSDQRYVYAYWDRYDTYMHNYGVDAPFCDTYLQYINEQISGLAAKLNKGTLLVVTADHGQIDSRRIYDLHGSVYEKYFHRRPSLEARAQVFFIEEGLKEEFELAFKQEFADDYILLSHEQVLQSHLFGPLDDHPRFAEFIGDFLAVAKSDLSFVYHEKPKKAFIGQHAGITSAEMQVPLIVYLQD